MVDALVIDNSKLCSSMPLQFKDPSRIGKTAVEIKYPLTEECSCVPVLF